jgi:formate hydrogenlyase subunit 4
MTDPTYLHSISVAGLQGIVLILIAPAVTGLLHFFKARSQGRRRRAWNIVQPYRDLFKLLRKPAVRTVSTSWVFALAPSALFASYGVLVFLVPVFQSISPIPGDLIFVVYVLGLARFVFSAAGLDAGAPFGGLGSGRAMFLHFLTEIGLIPVVAALMIRSGSVSLNDLFAEHQKLGVAGFFAHPELMLLGLSLALLILLEAGRIPIDNPPTHLELTMAHKAIALEYAGRDLALIDWAEMIKLTFLLTLLAGLFVPFPITPNFMRGSDVVEGGLILAGYTLKIIALTLLLSVWEMGQPKLRLRAVAGRGLTAMALSLTAIIYTIAIGLLK